MFRGALILVLALTLSACEAVGDIFQAGMVVGIVIVAVVVAVIAWLFRKMRGRG